MIQNTFKINLNRNLLRGLASVLCLVCTLLGPSLAHAQTTGKIAITFNGYENADFADMQHVNLDCSSLVVANGTNGNQSVTANGVTLTLTGYASDYTNAKTNAIVAGSKTAGYLFLSNQKFQLKIDGKSITSITAYYGESQPTGENYILTTLLRGESGSETNNALKGEEQYTYSKPLNPVKLCTQSDQTTKYGVCLQALVVDYTDDTDSATDPGTDEPSTASFTMPELTGVNVVSIKNGSTTLSGGESLEIGTTLTVALKPASADDVIAAVTYGGKPVNGTESNGTWSGTVEFAEGASFAVTLEKKEISYNVPNVSGVTFEVKNGSTVVTSGEKIKIGTPLSVKITPNDVKNKVTKVTYNGQEVTGSVDKSGAWTGTVELAQGASFTVQTAIKTFDVTVGTHADCTVKFVNPSNGQVLTMPVSYGTVVGIAVSDYPNTMQFGSATCTDSNGNEVATAAGTTYCAATVTVTDDLTVDVTLTEKTTTSIAKVSFPSVTGGTISVSADGTQLSNPADVATGTTLTVVLTPSEGYEVGTLIIDGKRVELDADNSATYEIPAEAKSVVITATFVKVYTITWDSQIENGSIKVEYNGQEISSGATVRGGESVTVTLTPNEGDMITSLSATGATVSSTSTKNVYKVTVSANTELQAYIGKELKSYDLVLQSASGGSIKIWNNPERTGTPVFSGASTKSIKEGTALYGTVTVNTGYTFESLMLGDAEVSVDEATGNFEILMPARAVYLTPTYTRIMPERTITVTVPEAQASMGSVAYQIGENGSLTAYTEPIKAKQSEVITFVIKANEGYRIKSVSPNLNYSVNTITEKKGTYTVGSSNATFTVNFEEIPDRTLTVTGINLNQLPTGVAGLTATYNGAPVVFGETTVPEGATIDFTIEAEPEYEITSFKVANAAGVVASNGETATGSYTVPANTARPSVNITYAVKHRTTNITFSLNNTNITNFGTVVATYKDGSTTKILQPNTATQTQSVPTATPMTIVVTPKTGYMVSALVINGEAVALEDNDQVSVRNNVVTATDYYTTPSYLASGGSDLIVEVEFAPIPTYYTLSITATGGRVEDKDKPLEVEYGTVTYSSTGDLSDMKKVLKDTEVTINVAPNLNYQIKSITVNGKAQSFDILSGNVSFNVTIKQNTTVAVVFEARTYRVQVSAPVNISEQPYIGSNKETTIESFKNGSSVTIHAQTNPGYTFEGWLCDGEYVRDNNGRLAGANYTFTMPQRDIVFTAVYTETRYTPHSVRIQVAEGQEGMGSIKIVSPTSTVWTNWNDQSAFIDQWDQMVRIEAVPKNTEPGRYYFDSWQVTGAALGTVTQNNTPELGSLEYGGNNNVSITAKFGRNCKVSLVAPVNGSVELTMADGTIILPNSPVFVKPGTRLTITMTANKNYYLATLVVNDRETNRYNRPGTVTQTITVNEDMNLNALFYNPTGIEDIDADNEAASEPTHWFTIQGQYIGTERPTSAGIYICRVGNKASKVVIK